ncbi:aminotransferase class I/II-fold pyridoxal phosphate-dependent enzyme [Streptosporangium lutulentum]|uniref:8-amino-7-oxononanoate synthase n=1 Tax=Streptosporangium lutulentum TaxID=1461250 RepID=A0ABT9QR13_9ACTN|nr:aminotransferase class I/II-fold pyridoxal phosphate-dependent enzyme [Streptosporangium lutulentum]MDP9849194.1 7-keto-8-aminopelargonate synthetase-like enzyme [Streptosporangium lutulentum]
MEQTPDPTARFREAAASREAAGLKRAPRVRTPDDDGLIDPTSDDRPGPAGDERPLEAATVRQGALPVADAAHPTGVIGPREQGAGLAAEPGVVRTLTLSESPGSRGGAVLATPEVVQALIGTGRSFVFDTGPAPGGVAAALSAVDILHNQPGLPGSIRTRARESASTARELGLETNDPAGAVVPIVLGPPETARRAALTCAEREVRAGWLRPPSVPVGRSCPRLTARANLSSDDLAAIGNAPAAVAETKVTK